MSIWSFFKNANQKYEALLTKTTLLSKQDFTFKNLKNSRFRKFTEEVLYNQRYRIFFSAEKFGGYSLTHFRHFFFPGYAGKKNKLFFRKILTKIFFFFAPGKVYPSPTHSISEGDEKKKTARKKKIWIFTHTLENPKKRCEF